MHLPGRLGLLAVLCLFSAFLLAQSPEDLLAREDYVAAAKAFTERGTRADHFAAGEAWLKADSMARAQVQFELVKQSKSDSLAALAWHKIGLVHYSNYDDASAAAAYQRAIQLRDSLFPDNHLDRAHSRANLAGSLIYLGQTDSAGTLLREAIDIYATASPTDTFNWLNSLADLMQVSNELQDYRVGMSAAESGINLLDQSTGPPLRNERSVLYRAASTFFHFGDGKRGRIYAQRMLELSVRDGDKFDQLQAYAMLAANASREGNNAAYLDYSLKSLTLATPDLADPINQGLPHYNLARAYGKKGELAKARFHADAATELLTEEAPQYLPGLASIRGDLSRRSGDYRAALTQYDHGLRLLSAVPPYGKDLHYPTPDSLAGYQLITAADLLADRADALSQLELTEAALRDYDLLFAVQDQLRGRVSSDDSRRYLSRNLRPYFDRAIDLHLARYQETQQEDNLWQALQLSERAKAYTLLTSIQRNRNAMPRREAELRTRIAELEREALTRNTAKAQLEAARLQLDRLLKLERDQLELPDFSLDRNAINQLLTEVGAGMLIFHLGEKKGHLFLLQQTEDQQLQIRWKDLGKTALLASRIEDFRKATLASSYRRKSLRSAAEQRQLDEAFLTSGLALTEQLQLTNGLAEGSLTIIPDGALNYLPFGALPLATAALPLNYSQLHYLQDKRQLNYTYSAAFLLALQRRPPLETEVNLLAYAPDFRGVSGPGASSRALVAPGKREGERSLPGLSPLRFNQPEVSAIGALIPNGKTFLAAEANRQNFLDHVGTSRILHLSTHGMVNAADPRLSFVAFSQQGDSLELEEMLYFNDLSALSLNTDMAVLSACETNLGAYVPGETTLSLASAFAAAGARSTLTTLWQVDDAATKDLMVRFYEKLTGGSSRGQALLDAQTMHRESGDFAHPYYWSAFTLYGATGEIDLATTTTNTMTYVIWAMGILTLGLLLLVVRKRLNEKKA